MKQAVSSCTALLLSKRSQCCQSAFGRYCWLLFDENMKDYFYSLIRLLSAFVRDIILASTFLNLQQCQLFLYGKCKFLLKYCIQCVMPTVKYSVSYFYDDQIKKQFLLFAFFDVFLLNIASLCWLQRCLQESKGLKEFCTLPTYIHSNF